MRNKMKSAPGGEKNNKVRGSMTVREAGKRGGQKGGQTTKMRYGKGFYSEIGTKGGQRVRELIREGKANERMEEQDSID